MSSPSTSTSPSSTIAIAAALALGAAVSLGLARFSYALLLPPMRFDLGWSYLTAGAMNTGNAAGYLAGALLMPTCLRRFGARAAFLGGGVGVALLLVGHGLATADAPLYVLRFLTGVASAATFVSGGLLAARLVGRSAATPTRPAPTATTSPSPPTPRAPPSAGLVLGIYYGGAGAGITVSAVLVPPLCALPLPHAWHWAWIALGLTAALATVVTAWMTRGLAAPSVAAATRGEWPWRRFGFGLVSYFLFGLGYIGYMTFVVTLLREQHLGSATTTLFFALLGLAAVASPWLWAGRLQRHRGGESLRLLNALLAVATVLPVLSVHPVAVFGSGLLFGAVFLSVVASTTALVRHNLPPAAWPAGISAFTTLFAAGQIVGPSLVGWVADGAGGLQTGLAVSAGVLVIAALLASGQKPLPA